MSVVFFCFHSILHARRHSSQQVCRHRITGQQLSEHPAADTGRSLGIYWQSISACQKKNWERRLVCFDCDYRSNSGNLLTVWMCARIFLIPSLSLKPAAGFPPHLVSHHPTVHRQCVHLYICIFLYVCGLPYVLNCLFGTYGACPSDSRPSPSLPSSLLLLDTFPSTLPANPPHTSHSTSLSNSFLASSCSALFSPSHSFSLPFTFSLFHLLHPFLSLLCAALCMPPLLPLVFFSLVSNHTRLEPAQLRSSTHGNHLKVLCWSPPLFLCPPFSHFYSLCFFPIPDLFWPSAHYTQFLTLPPLFHFSLYFLSFIIPAWVFFLIMTFSC